MKLKFLIAILFTIVSDLTLIQTQSNSNETLSISNETSNTSSDIGLYFIGIPFIVLVVICLICGLRQCCGYGNSLEPLPYIA